MIKKVINQNMKYYNEGHSVAEFLILPIIEEIILVKE